MNVFIESLRRLFLNGTIDVERIASMVHSGKISKEEFDYIIRKER